MKKHIAQRTTLSSRTRQKQASVLPSFVASAVARQLPINMAEVQTVTEQSISIDSSSYNSENCADDHVQSSTQDSTPCGMKAERGVSEAYTTVQEINSCKEQTGSDDQKTDESFSQKASAEQQTGIADQHTNVAEETLGNMTSTLTEEVHLPDSLKREKSDTSTISEGRSQPVGQGDTTEDINSQAGPERERENDSSWRASFTEDVEEENKDSQTERSDSIKLDGLGGVQFTKQTVDKNSSPDILEPAETGDSSRQEYTAPQTGIKTEGHPEEIQQLVKDDFQPANSSNDSATLEPNVKITEVIPNKDTISTDNTGQQQQQIREESQTKEHFLEDLQDCQVQGQLVTSLEETRKERNSEGPQKGEELKTLIKELQDQLEVLIKDNTDKNVRIHKLEESLLQLNEKLGNGEKQTASSEKSSGRRDSTKSKICIIL